MQAASEKSTQQTRALVKQPKIPRFSAQLYSLLKSEVLQKIEVKRPRVDHSQRQSTLQQKALNRSAQKTESPKQISVEKQQLCSTRVREKGLQRLSNQLDHN